MKEIAKRPRRDELTEKEKHAARVWAEGMDIDGTPARTVTDVARVCGMTLQEFYLVRRKAAFSEEVDKCLTKMKADVGRELLRSVPSALEKLKKIMETGADREALAAAAKILSISGYSEHRTVDVNINDAAGVIRGGFGRQDLPEATVIDVGDYEMDGEDE